MLRPCPACRRHVAFAASQCDFCASPLPPGIPREPRVLTTGRLGRAAIFAGAIAVAPLGCGDPAPRYETLPQVTGGTAMTTGEVKGRVLRHDGSVAAGAYLTLYGEVLRQHPSSNGHDSLSVQADNTGSFTFRDIPPGEYRFALAGRGRQEKVTVRAGQAIVLDVTQDEPQRPHGGAKPYGAPPARRRVV